MKYHAVKLALAALLFFPQLSHAGFGAQGGLNTYKPKRSGPAYATLSTEAKPSYALRAYLYESLAPFVVMEGGASFLERKYRSFNSTTVNETIDYRAVGADLLLRVSVPMLSVGVGGFFMVLLPDATVKPQGGTFSVRSLASLGMKYRDYGLVASARLRLPMGLVGLTAEARYQHGLANIHENNVSKITTSDTQLLVGLDF